MHDNDADLVIYGCENWDALLANLREQLPQFKVIWCVPSEDTSIRWIRVLCGAGVMDLVSEEPMTIAAVCVSHLVASCQYCEHAHT